MVVEIYRRAVESVRRRFALSFVSVLLLMGSGLSHALTNSGFDDELNGWMVQSGAADVAVIQAPGDDCNLYLAYQNIACDPGDIIAVITGQKMVRLGTPKVSNESQDQTPITLISDPFQVASSSLTLAARLFSYEFRGDDQFIVEVLDLSGMPLEGVNVSVDFGETGSCFGNPCIVNIDVGRRDNKAPFDSATLNSSFNGAQDIVIEDLPVGEQVQLRYTLNPSNNEAHPTWVYLDNRNSPPIAVIEFGPGDPNLPAAAGFTTPAAALEGDFVSANCNASSDPENDALTCNWKAWGGGLDATAGNPVEQLDTTVAVFYFPDSSASTDCEPSDPVDIADCPGYPTIQLEVSDGQAPPVVTTVKVNLLNAQPVVGATDLEVLVNGTGTTVCRFADTGIGEYGGGDGLPGNGTVLTWPELGESCVPSNAPCTVSGVEMGALDVIEKRVEHVAEFASGFAVGEFAAGSNPGVTSVVCEVTDKDNVSGSDTFYVSVVEEETVEMREPAMGNETAAQADTLKLQNPGACLIDKSCAASGSSYLAELETPQDLDVYVLRSSTGEPFSSNSDVLVTLDVPADYELLILARLKDGLVSSPFLSSPRVSAPFLGSALTVAPFLGSALNQAPFFNTTFNPAPFFGSGLAVADPVAAPFFNSTFQPAPFFSSGLSPAASPFYNTVDASNPFDDTRLSFDTLPLTKVGLALPSSDGISGEDYDLTDTGSLSTLELQSEPDLQVVDISANVSDQTEAIMFKATGNVEGYYAVVFGSYGAFSSAPYSLRVESSSPPSQEALWANSTYCDPDTTFMPGGSYPAGSGPIDSHQSAQTLIITQKERFETVYPDANFDDLVMMLRTQIPGAAVISVPPDWYAAADAAPCQVQTRNDLLQMIKDTYIVDPSNEFYSPSLQSIVVLGDGSVVPPYARLDTTLVGNEADFANQSPTIPGTWTSTALAEGYNSTYAFLADREGIDFEGDKLWIEDVALSVLVGDPGTPLDPGPLRQEINAGSPVTDYSVITGYEAFADSAEVNASLLGGTQSLLIDPDENPNPWSAQELRGIYDDGMSCTTQPAIALVNLQTHMTPQLLWSSEGYRQNDFTDVVSALEPKSCLNGSTATLSLGCHSGLEIPKLQAPPPAPGQADPAKDWVDEIGALIAPIGYGLGDKFVADRVTEGLLTRTIEAATDPTLNLSLPQALAYAKKSYLLSVPDFDAHDADALMVLTAFMMPNFKLEVPPAGALASAASSAASAPCTVLPDTGVLDLTFYKNGAPSGSASPVYGCQAPSGFGEYNVLAPGGASGAYNRPLLPFTVGVEAQQITANQPFNDVLLVNRGAATADCPDGLGGLTRPCRVAATFIDSFDVDPVFSFPETNWSQPPDDLSGAFSQNELDSCVPNLAPFPLSYFTTVGDLQTQIIRGAQFRCEEELGFDGPGGVRGTHRRFDALHLDALQANVDGTSNPALVDKNPPQATVLEFQANPDTNNVLARIAATDANTGGSNICEMTVLVYYENIDGLGGGIVESYSTRYDTVPTYTGGAVIPNNQIVEFNLPQARGNRLASQICDCDGNCVYKTLKGGLLVALDVQVVSLILVPGELKILVENYANLDAPTLELEICSPTSTCVTYLYDLQDLPNGGDPSNPALEISSPNAEGVVTITVAGVANAGDTVTATVRSGGAFGTDTATLRACEDAVGDTSGLLNGDIAQCAVRPVGNEFAFDLILVDDSQIFPGGVLDEDVKYRLDFVNLGTQVQYFQGTNPDQKKNGKISGGPPGWKDVRAIFDGTAVRGLSFVFSESELESMGWTGGTLQIRFETQSGVPGAPSQGIPDVTLIFDISLEQF